MKEHDWEIREEAERLYVEDGLSYAEICKQLNVPVKTLQRWSVLDGKYACNDTDERMTWSKKRQGFIRDRITINQNFRDMVKNSIANASTGKDPKYVFAALAALKEERERRGKPQGELKIDKPRLFMEHVEYVVKYLKDNDMEAFQLFARNLQKMIRQFKKENV